MNGELRIVSDVPSAFARLVSDSFSASCSLSADAPFRIAASGGSSGAACFRALSRADLDFSKVELYFVDERCVEVDSPDSNQFAIGQALGEHRDRLRGFFPMSCAEGPKPYADRLQMAGRLDIVQLGLGPDGHTASMFPGSVDLELPSEQLTATTTDPSGKNAHERMTLTYSGIALGEVVVICVIGEARAPVVRAIVDGENYPASRVTAAKLIWLIDDAAASLLEGEAHD